MKELLKDLFHKFSLSRECKTECKYKLYKNSIFDNKKIVIVVLGNYSLLKACDVINRDNNLIWKSRKYKLSQSVHRNLMRLSLLYRGPVSRKSR